MIPILYHENGLLVCLKPPGAISQDGPADSLPALLRAQTGGEVYPVHRLDDSGALGDVTPDGDAPAWQRPKKEKKPKNKKKERMDALENAIAVCNLDEAENVSIQAVMDYTGKTKATIKNWVEEHPGYTIQGSMIIKKSKEDTA